MMSESTKQALSVPFFRPTISQAEVDEVVDCIRSGWLTTGPRVKQFEDDFKEAVVASHAVAVNSCTAALHLAVEALGLTRGQGVLVPTMTFAATAEIVCYQGAKPILVDCDPTTFNMDFDDAQRKISAHASDCEVVGMIPVHVGGLMVDMHQAREIASAMGIWLVEDAAHALPAAMRTAADQPWQRCGEHTADVTCYSFYANKTITTGEGGMAVTNDDQLAARMRQMSLHGLTHDAWKRYSGGASWDYRIAAPGFKYNMTDVAAAIGIHQLRAAESFRIAREQIAKLYTENFASLPQLALPTSDDNRIHSWHLYPIRLQLDTLTIDRNQFVQQLRDAGVGCSVHWRPLHLHPYYAESMGWQPEDCPTATRIWPTLITLPLFPSMTAAEQQHVVDVVSQLCHRFAA